MLGSADNGVPVLATPEARRRSLVLPLIIAALVAALAVLLAASGRSEALVGSGSTLAQPLIERSAGAFRNAATADNPSRPGETGSDWVLDGSGLEYEPVGSLGGIMRLSDGGAHFAVSDYPLTKEALEERKLAQFPVAVGAVAVVHTLDLPDDATLKLDAETVQIFRNEDGDLVIRPVRPARGQAPHALSGLRRRGPRPLPYRPPRNRRFPAARCDSPPARSRAPPR